MIEESYTQLKREIAACMAADRGLLDQLRTEIRPLRSTVRRIHPRTTTSLSIVATDGGNISLQFDPFLVEVVRVVDSNNSEYCLEAITPTTNVAKLSEKQFNADGSPCTRLGQMMQYLGVRNLWDLSPKIHNDQDGRPRSPSWVKSYRELAEWAILFSLVREKDFGSDTLVVYDGLLRSTIFEGDLFKKYLEGLLEGIELQKKRNRLKIYLAGVAKYSKVLARYRLAMALENILTTNYPAYVAVPQHIEEKAYVWTEYARGDDQDIEGKGIRRCVGGTMFFVKFGNSPRDPIWPIDIYLPQKDKAPHILGCLLADAINGFPMPLYPQCLQKAHANAALIDFDFDILQNAIFDGIRQMLPGEATVLDIFRMQEADPAQRRYE